MREYAAGQAEAGTGQHGGPKQGMKIDNILADEMINLIFAVRFPVFIEIDTVVIVTVMQEAGDVANRRIQPDVEVFIAGTRDQESEVGFVPGYISVSQARLKPFLQFTGDVLVQVGFLDPAL